MKIIFGDWSYGKTVGILRGGKVICRKVHYSSLDGCYVVIDGEKVGYYALESREQKIVRYTEQRTQLIKKIDSYRRDNEVGMLTNEEKRYYAGAVAKLEATNEALCELTGERLQY